MAKNIKTEVNFEKRDNNIFVLTQTQVDEFSRAEMDSLVKAQMLNNKKQVEMELAGNESSKKLFAELVDKPELKKFVSEKFQLREFTADEIEVKNKQLGLLDEQIANIDKVVGASDTKPEVVDTAAPVEDKKE